MGFVSSLLDYVAQQAKDKLTISFVKAFLEFVLEMVIMHTHTSDVCSLDYYKNNINVMVNSTSHSLGTSLQALEGDCSHSLKD